MNLKKILIIATTPIKKDGLTEIMLNVYKYYKDEIHFEISTYTDIEEDMLPFFQTETLEVNRVSNRKNVFKYIKDLVALIKDKDFDAVYIHGNSALILVDAIPAKIVGLKQIITHCHNTKSKFPLIHYVFKPFLNLIVTDKIACSDLAAKWLYYKDYKVVLNGVKTEKFKFDADVRNKYRKELGLENNFVVGHVGRFNIQKNHDFLIDVFNEVVKLDSSAMLLLVGKGELKNEIEHKVREKKLEKNVIFLGNRDDVNCLMQAMDVFLFPSLWEGLGIVAIEAQVSGLPVVVSDVVPDELEITNSIYWLSLKDSPQKWAESLIKTKNQKRFDASELVAKKNMDEKSMLESLRKVLCK